MPSFLVSFQERRIKKAKITTNDVFYALGELLMPLQLFVANIEFSLIPFKPNTYLVCFQQYFGTSMVPSHQLLFFLERPDFAERTNKGVSRGANPHLKTRVVIHRQKYERVSHSNKMYDNCTIEEHMIFLSILSSKMA